MGNFFDYLNWRGDLSFENAGLNEVDCLILSYFAYADLEGIVPETPYESVMLSMAAAKYAAKRAAEAVPEETDMFRDAAKLFIEAGKMPRFAKCRLSYYVNHLDYEKQKQFCALCIQIDEDKLFVSYCGTDETILGWKENFNMTFLSVIPSQEEAQAYIAHAGGVWDKKIVCGGHSKGGNLAVYAAAMAPEEVRQRIYYIFNFDGPGFSEEFIRGEAYRSIEARIRTMLPQTSVVGLLLEHSDSYEVIKTSEHGIIAQHMATSWEIEGPNFVRVSGVSRQSHIMDTAIRDWLLGLDAKARQEFTDTLFMIFEDAGIHTVGELMGNHLHLTTVLTKEYKNLSEEQRSMVSQAVKELLRIANATYRESTANRNARPKLFARKSGDSGQEGENV